MNWPGTDGSLLGIAEDRGTGLQINARLTAPLPDEFPGHRMITGLAVISDKHSLVIEVKNPREGFPPGCPYDDVPQCLANGGLRVEVDGKELDEGLLRFSRDYHLVGNISISAANLPVACSEFGGGRLWAGVQDGVLQTERKLAIAGDGHDELEGWILSTGREAEREWCARFPWATTDGITESGANLPAECLKFLKEKKWARSREASRHVRRKRPTTDGDQSFEDWILGFGHRMVARDGCARYIERAGLSDVRSSHAVFRIVVTPTITVRLVVGLSKQARADVGVGGSRAPPLAELWQMNVGLEELPAGGSGRGQGDGRGFHLVRYVEGNVALRREVGE